MRGPPPTPVSENSTRRPSGEMSPITAASSQERSRSAASFGDADGNTASVVGPGDEHAAIRCGVVQRRVARHARDDPHGPGRVHRMDRVAKERRLVRRGEPNLVAPPHEPVHVEIGSGDTARFAPERSTITTRPLS